MFGMLSVLADYIRPIPPFHLLFIGAIVTCSQERVPESAPSVGQFRYPFAARVGDSQNEVSIMKKKIAVRTAIASAVIAPAMIFAGGTAAAVPALSAGASGEVVVTVPPARTGPASDSTRASTSRPVRSDPGLRASSAVSRRETRPYSASAPRRRSSSPAAWR